MLAKVIASVVEITTLQITCGHSKCGYQWQARLEKGAPKKCPRCMLVLHYGEEQEAEPGS